MGRAPAQPQSLRFGNLRELAGLLTGVGRHGQARAALESRALGTLSDMCLLPPSLEYDFQDYPTMAGGSIMDRMWVSGGSRCELIVDAVLIGSWAV